jgi:hypothetical protein
MTDGLYNWFDNRLNLSSGGRKALNKIFPDHWSFMIGEICLYSFVVLLATGVFLSLYFVPSTADVVYHGPYVPLDGVHMSAAYLSTINLSFSVRAGLLMRQMHHWAANIFVGAIVVHMARVFFTGAFRRPREINWIIGMNMLILAIFNGFLGYSLPDDLVSGTGIRIAYSILESLPFVGTYLANFLFGGSFPGNDLIPRFYLLHVLILPAVIAGLLGAHLTLLVRQKHTQRMRRVTRQNLDMPFPQPPRKFTRNIALNPLEMRQTVLIPLLPLPGQIGQMKLPGLLKPLPVFRRAPGSLVKICRKSGLETLVRKLLKEDGGQTDSYRWPGLEEGAFTNHVQNGQIRLRRRLIQPGLSVGIRTVMQHIRQMSMQNNAQRPKRIAHWGHANRGKQV